MHDEFLFFSKNKDFFNRCSKFFPPLVRLTLVSDYHLIEKYLLNPDRPVLLVDCDSVEEQFLLNLEQYGDAHNFYLLTEKIPVTNDGSASCRYSVPFGLKKLLEGKYFNSHKEIAVSEDEEAVLASLEGSSAVIKKVRNRLLLAARQEWTVLLTGENGTGKSMAAAIIHSLSDRKSKKMVMENVAAISESLMESELFGSSAGAFTGAVERRKGLVGEAENSTLFLDEIGELPLALQTKLLNLLQEKTVRGVGESHGRKVNVRMIFATNADIEDMVRSKLFREDLFYRINQIHIRMPPLRERVEDIEILAENFLRKQKKKFELSSGAKKSLKKYHWPGNIRQLENVLRTAMLNTSEKVISRETVDFCLQDQPSL